MASTSSRIQIILDGDASGITRASAAAGLAVSAVSKSFGVLATASKGLAVLGGAGGAIQLVAGVTAALQQLAPIALLAPAAILAVGAAFATVKIATAGFADALGGDAEALAKLAPSARETVQAIDALKKPFDEIRKATQQQFFAGFAGEMRDLGSKYLPVLSDRLPQVAESFNEMGRSLSFALKQPSTVTGVDTILENTSKLIGNAKNALGGFARGFVELGAFGSDYLPRIGIAIDGVAQKFEAWVKNGLKDNSIMEFVDFAIEGFRDLGAIIGNVGSVIASTFRGLAGDGGLPILDILRDATDRLAAFMKGAEAQGPLKALGETLRIVGGILTDVVIAGFKFLGPIIEAAAPIVQKLAEVVGKILVEAFEKLGPPIERLLIKLGPVLGPALDFIGQVIIDVVIPALVLLIDWLSDSIDKMELFAAQSVAGMAIAASAVLGFVSGFLDSMQSVFDTLGQVPGAFGEPFRQAAATVQIARDKVDNLQAGVDALKGKAIEVAVEVKNRQALDNLIYTLNTMPTQKLITITTQIGAAAGLVAGARASGGPVSAGRTYLVGEQGPELVTMGQSGYVTPNHQLSGTGGGDISVRVFIGDQELRTMVRTEVEAADADTVRAVRVGPGVTF